MVPTISFPTELREGMAVDLNCSTPYACLEGQISLQWQGQDPSRSVTSNHLSLEPTGISHLQTLHMALTWEDHDRALHCQLSVANRKVQAETRLHVQCKCVGATPQHHMGTSSSSATTQSTAGHCQGGQGRWREPGPMVPSSLMPAFQGSVFEARLGRERDRSSWVALGVGRSACSRLHGRWADVLSLSWLSCVSCS